MRVWLVFGMADFCRLGKMDQSRFGTTDLVLKRSGVCVAKFERIRLGNRRCDSNKYRTQFKRSPLWCFFWGKSCSRWDRIWGRWHIHSILVPSASGSSPKSTIFLNLSQVSSPTNSSSLYTLLNPFWWHYNHIVSSRRVIASHQWRPNNITWAWISSTTRR